MKTNHKSQKMKEDASGDFPGYVSYPPSEDIYQQGIKEGEIDPEDISRLKEPAEKENSGRHETEHHSLRTGEYPEVPGAELDDKEEAIGMEDEENNYYSIGGDNHTDLEEMNSDLIENED